MDVLAVFCKELCLIYFVFEALSQKLFDDQDEPVVHLELIFKPESEWFHEIVVCSQYVVLQQPYLLTCQ